MDRDFIAKAEEAAEAAGHPFPTDAACEAALESGYGASGLAKRANNLFGMKQHVHPVFGTLSLPTKEWVGVEKDTQDGVPDGWITVSANWVSYPDWSSCFADRLNTLQRMAPKYPHYAAALAAMDGETFVREVSKTWSTDPKRADKVLAIKKLYLAQ